MLKSLVRSLAALAVVVAACAVSPRSADAQICSAGLDAKPLFCTVPTDCPGTNLSAIEPGDPVTITGQLTNTSSYATNPPPNPPGGVLQAGSTIKIYYACTNSSCTAGSEKADWLVYASSTLLGPAIGNATFSDDGNGYSGTLSITNPITFTEGDTNPLNLVQIDMTAGTRPPLPNSATIFYSRMATGPSAFEITSGGCLSGITGGGQGSTAAAFAATPTPTPTPTPPPTPTPSDLCRPCKHPCASRIFLTKGTGLDRTDLHLLMTPPPGCDPSTDSFSLSITNAGGTVFTDTVAAGALVERGSSWFYRNPSARQAGGFFKVKITPRTDPTGYRIDVQGFGDMSSATDPTMTVTTSMCGISSATTDAWIEQPSGWLANFDTCL